MLKKREAQAKANRGGETPLAIVPLSELTREDWERMVEWGLPLDTEPLFGKVGSYYEVPAEQFSRCLSALGEYSWWYSTSVGGITVFRKSGVEAPSVPIEPRWYDYEPSHHPPVTPVKSYRDYGDKAKSFRPHVFKTEVILEGVLPRVVITPAALDKIWCFVDVSMDEVGWLGAVEEKDNVFTITDAWLVSQEASPSHCELTEDGIADLGAELMARPDGMELVNKLRFWGHSHAHMGTFASQQDELQMELFRTSGHESFVRGIFNKKGEARFEVFFFSRGIVVADVEWDVLRARDESLRAQVEEDYRKKVKTRYPYQQGVPIVNDYLDVNVGNYIVDKRPRGRKGGG